MIVGRKNERLPDGDWSGFYVVLPSAIIERRVAFELADLRLRGLHLDGAGRIQRKNAWRAVHEIGLAEVGRRQELQVEAGAPLKPLWQRLVERHANPETPAFGSDRHARIEVELVVAQLQVNRVALAVDRALDQPGDLVPLFGCGLQSHCAAGCGSDAVVDELNAGGLLVEEETVVLAAEYQHV